MRAALGLVFKTLCLLLDYHVLLQIDEVLARVGTVFSKVFAVQNLIIYLGVFSLLSGAVLINFLILFMLYNDTILHLGRSIAHL